MRGAADGNDDWKNPNKKTSVGDCVEQKDTDTHDERTPKATAHRTVAARNNNSTVVDC